MKESNPTWNCAATTIAKHPPAVRRNPRVERSGDVGQSCPKSGASINYSFRVIPAIPSEVGSGGDWPDQIAACKSGLCSLFSPFRRVGAPRCTTMTCLVIRLRRLRAPGSRTNSPSRQVGVVVETGRRVGVFVHTAPSSPKPCAKPRLNCRAGANVGFYGATYRVKQDIGRHDCSCAAEALRHESRWEHSSAQSGAKPPRRSRFVGRTRSR